MFKVFAYLPQKENLVGTTHTGTKTDLTLTSTILANDGQSENSAREELVYNAPQTNKCGDQMRIYHLSHETV